MNNKIYVGDTGTKIKLYLGQDVSNATVKKIKYKRPDGSSSEWNASIEEDEYLFYITQENDLNLKGTWLLQAYIEMPDWKGHGETVKLTVYEAFN